MSPADLLEPARRDLQSLSVSPGDQEALAGRLGLSHRSLEPFVHTADGDLVRSIVRAALVVDRGAESDEGLLHRFAAIRIFFETLLAWEIAGKSTRKTNLVHRLRGVQVELTSLVEMESFTDETAERARKLDGQFHRELFAAAERPHLVAVVDIVLEQLRKIGLPSCLADIENTIQEHERIVEALDRKHPDRQELFRMIQAHVEAACERLCGRIALVDLRTEHLPDPNSPQLVASESAFQSALPQLLLTHPGQWAAFAGGKQVTIEKTRQRAYDKCRALKLTDGEFVVHQIEPPFAWDEIAFS